MEIRSLDHYSGGTDVSARIFMKQCASRNSELYGKNFLKSIGKRVVYQQESIMKTPLVNSRPPTYSIPEEKGLKLHNMDSSRTRQDCDINTRDSIAFHCARYERGDGGGPLDL